MSVYVGPKFSKLIWTEIVGGLNFHLCSLVAALMNAKWIININASMWAQAFAYAFSTGLAALSALDFPCWRHSRATNVDLIFQSSAKPLSIWMKDLRSGTNAFQYAWKPAP